MITQTRNSASWNFQVPDLIALYSEPYTTTTDHWRDLCAIDKAAHITDLSKNFVDSIDTVLEVGCGTGAVLRRLQALGFGTRLAGIEIGTSDRAKDRVEGGIELNGFDGVTIPFSSEAFDFVYATHVLEHVPHPRAFLSEMRRVSKHFVFVEVPCELHFRSSRKTLQHTLEVVGHINSFTPESFALLLETSGLRIHDLDVYDHRFEVHRFNSSGPKAALKLALRSGLLRVNKQLATRLFTYHCSALCEIAEPLRI